jgi:phage terminase Nu1 subunit (DNA packaging protein)
MKTKKQSSEEGFKTGPNIARILDVDPATIRRYSREGCPTHTLGPGYIRYKLDEVLAWLAQRKRKSRTNTEEGPRPRASGKTKTLKLSGAAR